MRAFDHARVTTDVVAFGLHVLLELTDGRQEVAVGVFGVYAALKGPAECRWWDFVGGDRWTDNMVWARETLRVCVRMS